MKIHHARINRFLPTPWQPEGLGLPRQPERPVVHLPNSPAPTEQPLFSAITHWLHQRLRPLTGGLLLTLSLATPRTEAALANLLPLKQGVIVGTCQSEWEGGGSVNTPVLGIIDTSLPEVNAAPLGVPSHLYPWKMFHNELVLQSGVPSAANQWTAGTMGEVFGLALDDGPQPNIYATATTIYGQLNNWPAGGTAGSVYKINGSTGVLSRLVNLPATGSGIAGTQASLGNVCFHRASNGASWLFVSNLDNGLIYRIDPNSGVIAETYDHGTNGRTWSGAGGPIPDTPATVFTASGRRVWGLEDYGGRLYYGVWYQDNHFNEVWSIGLNTTSGAFQTGIGTVKLEITVPALQADSKAPISDISFSGRGRLYLAERYHQGFPAIGGDSTLGAHRTRVLAYDLNTSGQYQNAAATFRVGPGDINSAGGVAVDCDGTLWATGDYLNAVQGAYVYGVQRIRPGGNGSDLSATLNSHIIDFNGAVANYDKTEIGDVETVPNPCTCLREIRQNWACRNGKQRWTLTFQNTGVFPISYIAIDNVTGGVTGPSTLTPVTPPMLVGDTRTVEIDFTVPTGIPLDFEFCFDLIVHKADLSTCCVTKFCTKPESCLCIDKETFPSKFNGNGTYCVTVTNLSGVTAHTIQFGSLSANLQSASLSCPNFPIKVWPLVPPLVSGQSRMVCVPMIAPMSCGSLNFYVALHGANGAPCCSKIRQRPWGFFGPTDQVAVDAELLAPLRLRMNLNLERVIGDNAAAIARVRYAVDGQVAEDVVNPPWGMSGPPIEIPEGLHRIQVTVITNDGAEFPAPERVIRVSAAGVITPAPDPVPFEMENYVKDTDQSLIMAWDFPGSVLQVSGSLNGPWQSLPNIPSPYIHTDYSSQQQRFFRLMKP
jgi:hypothetical protein